MTRKLSPLTSEPPGARRRSVGSGVPWLCTTLVLLIASVPVHADQVEMQNGDRYVGTVLSLNADLLVLQNEVLGTVKLPRAKVAHITMGPAAVADVAAKATRTNGPTQASKLAPTNATALALPPLTTNASTLQQVREQFLNDASPEARAKFTELAGGLLSGKLSVADIRAEAKSAAEQLRALKADLGEDAGLAVDGYLAILDRFLNEGKPPSATATNAPGKPTKSKPEPPLKED